MLGTTATSVKGLLQRARATLGGGGGGGGLAGGSAGSPAGGSATERELAERFARAAQDQRDNRAYLSARGL